MKPTNHEERPEVTILYEGGRAYSFVRAPSKPPKRPTRRCRRKLSEVLEELVMVVRDMKAA